MNIMSSQQKIVVKIMSTQCPTQVFKSIDAVQLSLKVMVHFKSVSYCGIVI